MKRKHIITLLSLALSIVIFAGCSASKTSSSSTSTANSSSNVSTNTTQNDSTKESSNATSEQEFNKKDNDILKEIKDSNVGVQVVDAFTLTLTYGKNDALGYTPLQKVNKFVISNISPLTSTVGIVDDAKLWKEVTIETDVDFEINDLNNMYERNGKYNGQGTFVLLYHLTKGSDNKLSWTYSSVKSLSSKVKITKK